MKNTTSILDCIENILNKTEAIKIGNLIKWKAIDTEATYNTVRIYRSTSETGAYAQIGQQDISDTSYYDPDGTTSSWYKIDFYDTVSAKVSSLSNAIKGGTFKAYCTPDDVRMLTNIKATDLTDTQLANLINYAGTQLNADMNVYYEKERINYIDEVKENEIDGINTTFYTENYPIGDGNDDFQVTTSDITVYQVDSDNVETELTVSSLDAAKGKWVLPTAPTADKKLYVTYNSVNRRVDTPDPLVKMACVMLTAAWAYSKLNIGKATRFRMGNLTVFRDMESGHKYYLEYVRILTSVNDRTVSGYKDTEYVM